VAVKTTVVIEAMWTDALPSSRLSVALTPTPTAANAMQAASNWKFYPSAASTRAK